MEEKSKILIVDNAGDRKIRIAALKDRGYAVYPARRLAEARNRCKPGHYDLILVNADDNQEAAVELCDSIRQLAPKQPVLLMTRLESSAPQRDYLVPQETSELTAKIDTLLKRPSSEGALAA